MVVTGLGDVGRYPKFTTIFVISSYLFFITGGNPLAVLRKQIGLQMTKIRRRCPLYYTTGEMVPRECDKTVELEFNRLLDSVSHLSHHLQVDHLNGRALSLGEALELVIK